VPQADREPSINYRPTAGGVNYLQIVFDTHHIQFNQVLTEAILSPRIGLLSALAMPLKGLYSTMFHSYAVALAITKTDLGRHVTL